MELKKLNRFFGCEKCGLLIETMPNSIGIPLCCGCEMSPLQENSSDGKTEKHVPVIRRYGDICHVFVGEEPHPMTEEHHIEWIEIYFDDKVFRHHLKCFDKPEAQFCGVPQDSNVHCRTLCNLHGIWTAYSLADGKK